MKIIRDKNLWLPKDVRSYEDPDTGVLVVGDTFRQLAVRSRQHRMSRGLPTENVDLKVEESICARLPEGHNYCRTAEDHMRIRKPLKTAFNWEDIKNFAASVRDTLQLGEVSQSEADDRSDICKGCPYNVNLPGCTSCSGLTRLAANTIFSFLGKKTVRQEDHLKQCGICGCSLTAKVWAQYPKENPQVKKHLEDYPEWCWVKK